MDPYRDPETGVLHNKLGITTAADLARAEYKITNLRIAELEHTAIPGSFDLEHLKKIHAHIFSDVYEWAGKTRTVNLTKRDPQDPAWVVRFAPVDKMGEVAESIRLDLAAWNNFKGENQKDFTTLMAATYVKWNYLHPFAEGNGRATQTMLSQLAHEANYHLDFSKVTPEEWNRAAARSNPQRSADDPTVLKKWDPTFIQDVFRRIVEPLKERVPPQERDR